MFCGGANIRYYMVNLFILRHSPLEKGTNLSFARDGENPEIGTKHSRSVLLSLPKHEMDAYPGMQRRSMS